MAYVGFNNNGYEYFDIGNYMLFSSDNTHDYLFEYVDKDLSRLPILYEQYISKKMDVTSLESKEYGDNDEEIADIIEILISAHPYYKIEYKKVIINTIGSYFNSLLVYLKYYQIEQEEEWYIKKITHLMPSSIVKGSNYPEGLHPLDFYNKYRESVGENICTGTEIEETFICDPEEKPTDFYNKSRESIEENICIGTKIKEILRGPEEKQTKFYNKYDEIYTQKAICNLLYFILDISEENMRSLTLPQRIWLYNKIFNPLDVQPLISATHCFLLQSPVRHYAGQDYSKQVDYNRKIYKEFTPLFTFKALNVCRDGIPTNMEESFKSAVNFAKGITASGIYEKYEVDNLYQLLHLEVLFMINANIMIKKCKNCGKYFIVNDRKKAYCDRVFESGESCSSIGPKRSFKKKMESEPALALYNCAYKTHHARVKNSKMSMDSFSSWSKEAKERLEKVRSGELDIDVFQKWLKD